MNETILTEERSQAPLIREALPPLAPGRGLAALFAAPKDDFAKALSQRDHDPTSRGESGTAGETLLLGKFSRMIATFPMRRPPQRLARLLTVIPDMLLDVKKQGQAMRSPPSHRTCRRRRRRNVPQHAAASATAFSTASSIPRPRGWEGLGAERQG